jgi:hypothetical protein
MPSPQYVVYAIGVALFAFFYGQVKDALGGGAIFALAALSYLVVLRLIGWLVVRLLAVRSAK